MHVEYALPEAAESSVCEQARGLDAHPILRRSWSRFFSFLIRDGR